MGVSQSKDMAICLVVFNSCKTKRILMNYLFTVNQFKLQNLPTFTIELVLGDSKPEILDAIHVHSNSHMFHKERLCRLLEKEIPSKYKKLVFMDADLVFNNSSWYYKVSKLLNTYDVVQPFETANWLDLTYRHTIISRKTALLMESDTFDFNFHPGFAWAMKRSWYNKVGFFDYAITGSGDTLSVASWLNKSFSPGFKSRPNALKNKYEEFCKLPKPKITYLKGETVSHLYHGSRENRQYTTRHKLIDIQEDISELLFVNSNGVYEWKRPEIWNPLFLDYFRNRYDDDLSILQLDCHGILTS